jgi:hypothetical protein
MAQLAQKVDLAWLLDYAHTLERQGQAFFDKSVAPVIGIQSSIRRVALGLGLVSTVSYFVSKYVIYRLFLHKTNRIPGPPVDWIPFAGNMPEIIREEVKYLSIDKSVLSYLPIFLCLVWCPPQEMDQAIRRHCIVQRTLVWKQSLGNGCWNGETYLDHQLLRLHQTSPDFWILEEGAWRRSLD